MIILQADNWQDYELLDSGEGKRLERFGEYFLIRPDPQVIWKPSLPTAEWQKADVVFEKTSGEKGAWKKNKNVPESWKVSYQGLTFLIKLSPFKHTGIFPEQVAHWEWVAPLIENRGGANILNLFGYTGAASLVAAKAGAKVTHVDASFPTIGWARENQKLSGLDNKPIRWILDDCLKFCQREVKRGVKYDGIIMDPPVYGHGPKGEVWDFNRSFPELMEACKKILSGTPLFFVVNAYAISSSSITLENVLRDYLNDLGGEFESGELALKDKSGKLLSTGIFARWSKT